MPEVHIPSIQWFPGHMAKTRRLMSDNLKLVDLVVELRDARIPNASSNPEISAICGSKPRVLLLAKSDLADEKTTRAWCEYYQKTGVAVLAVDCRSGNGLNAFENLVRRTLADLIERRKAKGMKGNLVRLMVAGVPNVGKSSLINRLSGQRRAVVADRPGVTRGKQWVRAGKHGMEVLDMPGVLWPKFEDPLVGECLALTGAVKDDILDIEALACCLLARLWKDYPALLCERFRFEQSEGDGLDTHELLALIAIKRGMLLPGGVANTERASIILLDEFRAGKIGRISLEKPPAL